MAKNNKSFNIISQIIIAIVVMTMAILLYGCKTNNKKLSFYDDKSNKLITSIDIGMNTPFSIDFIHSVNKTKITDYYTFDTNNDIILNKTNYKSFGAGVPTEITGNENFILENDGSYTINNINQKLGNITLYLSDIYEHTLTINNNIKYPLWELIGKKKTIRIKIENG